MLTIYTSEEEATANSSKTVIKDVEAFFNIMCSGNSTLFRDAVSEQILIDIEGMKQRFDSFVIDGKFGVVSLNDISSGGKALLLAYNYRDNYIFNANYMGYNSIYKLFNLCKAVDMEVLTTRSLDYLGSDIEATIGGKRYTGDDITFELIRRYEAWAE